MLCSISRILLIQAVDLPGTFLRSKSFSSASANQKVKRVDEVAPQKHKSNREAAFIGTKGEVNRTMGKSRSFHSVNSGGSNSTDSKAKVLSPKSSHGLDMKGQKHTKERSLVERKNSLRLERPLVNSAVTNSTTTSPRVDRNLPVRDETVPFSSTSNNREFKSMHSDNRLTKLSRPVNKVINRGSEVPVPSGMLSCCIFFLYRNVHDIGEDLHVLCVYMFMRTHKSTSILILLCFPCLF